MPNAQPIDHLPPHLRNAFENQFQHVLGQERRAAKLDAALDRLQRFREGALTQDEQNNLIGRARTLSVDKIMPTAHSCMREILIDDALAAWSDAA